MRTLNDQPEAQVYTRRQFLTYQVVVEGVSAFQAIEAVASTALEHPEWDMDETMTWAQWEAQEQEQRAS